MMSFREKIINKCINSLKKKNKFIGEVTANTDEKLAYIQNIDEEMKLIANAPELIRFWKTHCIGVNYLKSPDHEPGDHRHGTLKIRFDIVSTEDW